MKAKEILSERFINLWTPEQKAPWANQVWDMLNQSYEKMGGFKSAKSVEDLINDSSIWKLVTRDGKLSAVSISKDSSGRKAIATGQDGTARGKADAISIMKTDVKLNRSWAEVSGAPEKIMMRMGAKPVPNKYAADLLGKEILNLSSDGYHYTRMLGDKPTEKIIFGAVNISDEVKAKLKSAGIELNDF